MCIFAHCTTPIKIYWCQCNQSSYLTSDFLKLIFTMYAAINSYLRNTNRGDLEEGLLGLKPSPLHLDFT